MTITDAHVVTSDRPCRHPAPARRAHRRSAVGRLPMTPGESGSDLGREPRDPPDAVLVARFQAGDHDAFAEIFEREWPAIHGLLAASVRDRAEVEDLTQEVFTRAFTGLARYVDTGRPLTAYLAEIGRNLLRDRWRRQQTRPTMVSNVPETASDRPSPDAVMETAEDRLRLVAALGRLPDQYRRVLHLRVVEGRSSAEVGAMFSINANALRQLQFRALQALRTQMQIEPGASAEGEGD